MTVQADELDPERAPQSAPDYLHDPWFTWPQRVPWSELGRDVMRAWGRADPADPQPEHLEIVGPSGSGKTYLLATLLQDRYRTRKSAATLICTKPADKVVHQIGWPITDDFDEAARRGWTNFVYWPRTRRMGTDRREFHEQRISHVLNKLWRPNANRIVAFDEVGYVESLSGDVKALVQQYWREARSQGITVAAMKQRPQGALRDMHSETYWTAAFPPKDRSDLERFAELFGHRRDWMPVFNSLDQDRREFILRHSRSREAYISWIDTPLHPQKTGQRGPLWLRALRGERAE